MGYGLASSGLDASVWWAELEAVKPKRDWQSGRVIIYKQHQVPEDEPIEGEGNEDSSGQKTRPKLDGFGTALIGGALALMGWAGGSEGGHDNLFIGMLQCGQ